MRQNLSKKKKYLSIFKTLDIDFIVNIFLLIFYNKAKKNNECYPNRCTLKNIFPSNSYDFEVNAFKLYFQYFADQSNNCHKIYVSFMR